MPDVKVLQWPRRYAVARISWWLMGNLWVGIEVSRVVDPQSSGELSVGGVNLLEHQLKIARKITSPDSIFVLTPQGDERILELVGKYEAREVAPFAFISMLSERAAAGEAGAVVHLRQVAPLRDERDVLQAVQMLDSHPVIISASKPPSGHPRHDPLPGETEPDYRCLAFEVRRISEFRRQPSGDEHLLFIDWDSFAEVMRREDEPRAAELFHAWAG
jgi:hypothetical protein